MATGTTLFLRPAHDFRYSWTGPKPFKANTLRHWSSRLGAVGVEGAESVELGEFRMARVVRAAASAEPERETAIVLDVGCVRVEVRRGFDAGALRGVLGVLGGVQ